MCNYSDQLDTRKRETDGAFRIYGVYSALLIRRLIYYRVEEKYASAPSTLQNNNFLGNPFHEFKL